MKLAHALLATASLFFVGATAVSSSTASDLSHRHRTPLRLPGHIGPYEAPYKAPAKTRSGTWRDLSGTLPFKGGPDTALLLTDGTVLEYDGCQGQWYKLTPDKRGKYEKGTWSAAAAMPAGYAPEYFASQILPDGRLIVNGGEYNNCNAGWTNKGALYDPVSDSWTSVPPPSGWSTIGDAQSVILPDGSYMLANCCNSDEAIAAISGTTVTWTSTGSGKADPNGEEGWSNLPGGDVLTVDATKVKRTGNNYEIYDPSAGSWTSEGYTPDLLGDGRTG